LIFAEPCPVTQIRNVQGVEGWRKFHNEDAEILLGNYLITVELKTNVSETCSFSIIEVD
jgi:hypothetical protein